MRTYVCLFLALILAGAASAESARSSAADTDFVRKASSGNLTEISLGKLAADQASSDDVKKYAARMVTDHTEANEKLGKLAGSKGVQIATAPDMAQQQDIDRLKGLDGAAFDRAYSDLMVKSHKLTTGLYELEATKGEDAEIRAFAHDTLPVLREHEKLADSLPPF
ncbi:putative membrane protein [Luteibacter sp. HA06]